MPATAVRPVEVVLTIDGTAQSGPKVNSVRYDLPGEDDNHAGVVTLYLRNHAFEALGRPERIRITVAAATN